MRVQGHRTQGWPRNPQCSTTREGWGRQGPHPCCGNAPGACGRMPAAESVVQHWVGILLPITSTVMACCSTASCSRCRCCSCCCLCRCRRHQCCGSCLCRQPGGGVRIKSEVHLIQISGPHPLSPTLHTFCLQKAAPYISYNLPGGTGCKALQMYVTGGGHDRLTQVESQDIPRHLQVESGQFLHRDKICPFHLYS